MCEQQILFEQFGQRIERSLDRAERDRDSYAIDKIVSEPIERITQRVVECRHARSSMRATFGPQIQLIKPPLSAGQRTRGPKCRANRTAEAADAFAGRRIERALRGHASLKPKDLAFCRATAG